MSLDLPPFGVAVIQLDPSDLEQSSDKSNIINPVAEAGVELGSVTGLSANDLRRSHDLSGAESGAVSPGLVMVDADLAAVQTAWPTLSADLRRRIAALALGATKG